MGIASNIGAVWLAKQTGKGAPAAAPTVGFKAAGPVSLRPAKERGRYNVTDTGRDEGPAYTAAMYVAGEIPLLMEPSGMALLWYLSLGANADSGAGPNFTHTGTPANDLPYCTIWTSIGNQIREKFHDCKVLRHAGEGVAGGYFTITLGVEGIKSTFEAADPVLAVLEPAGLLFAEIASKAKFDTVAQAIHRLSYEVNNGGGRYQADDFLPKDIDVGRRAISFTVGLRFAGATAFPKYREFFYGSDAGTELSPVVGTHAFDILIERNVNLSQQIQMPEFSYAGVPVQLDPSGEPIDIELAGMVEKPVGATPIMTVISKDQNATV